MGGRLALIVWLGGCAFTVEQPPGVGGDDDGTGSTTDPDPGSDPSQPPACVGGFFDLCDQAPPTEALAGNQAIDTDHDPRCRTLHQTGARDVCLIYATDVTIASGVTIAATGSRPLAIAAPGIMRIEGTLDVSSTRGGRTGAGAEASCTFAQPPEQDIGGAGGGAGGTFAQPGGDGGTGDTDTSAGPTFEGSGAGGRHGAIAGTLVLRGGCAGQRGANESASGGDGGGGGAGGGSVYLHAERVELSGQVRATGAGGAGGQVQSGGGGGGTGGYIVIEAQTIAISGRVTANGGGGGQGGGRLIDPPQSFDVVGNPGIDGDYGLAAALGGTSQYTQLGFGGVGGAGTAAAASGTSAVTGGGGGGGSVGVIALLGARQINGVISPPPQ